MHEFFFKARLSAGIFYRAYCKWKALDNIDLNQMSHRYVSGDLQND